MQAEVARDRPRARPRARRAQLHGRHRPDHERARPTSATSRRTCRAAASPGSPSRVGHRRVRPLRARGSASRGSSAAAPRWSSTSATTSPTASTTRRRSSVILFVEGFKRPERFLALADRALELGKPIMAVKVGRSRAGPGRGDRPLRLARRRGPGDRRRARRRRRDPLRATSTSCSRRPSSSRASGGPAGGWGAGGPGVVTVSTGEALADRRPGARRPGVDLPPIPAEARARDPGGAADDGLHRQPARSVGRGRPGDRLRRRVRGDGGVAARTTCWSLVHDFPYRSAAVRGRDRQRRAPSSCSPRPATGRTSCRSTSRSPRASRRPRPRRVLDGDGGGAPLLRGAVEAFRAIAARRPLGGRRERRRRRAARGGRPGRRSPPTGRRTARDAGPLGVAPAAAPRPARPARAREPGAPARRPASP